MRLSLLFATTLFGVLLVSPSTAIGDDSRSEDDRSDDDSSDDDSSDDRSEDRGGDDCDDSSEDDSSDECAPLEPAPTCDAVSVGDCDRGDFVFPTNECRCIDLGGVWTPAA